MKPTEKICSCCGKKKKIVNSFHKLCLECNRSRLSEYKEEEVKEPLFKKTEPKTSLFKADSKTKSKKEGLFYIPKPKKAIESIKADELFYEKCFNNSDHLCEECNEQLPDVFRGEDGKILARYRYSHIVPKSIAPELRHNEDNINHLCLKCHERWENRDKENMNIFVDNVLRFPNYFSLLLNK